MPFFPATSRIHEIKRPASPFRCKLRGLCRSGWVSEVWPVDPKRQSIPPSAAHGIVYPKPGGGTGVRHARRQRLIQPTPSLTVGSTPLRHQVSDGHAGSVPNFSSRNREDSSVCPVRSGSGKLTAPPKPEWPQNTFPPDRCLSVASHRPRTSSKAYCWGGSRWLKNTARRSIGVIQIQQKIAVKMCRFAQLRTPTDGNSTREIAIGRSYIDANSSFTKSRWVLRFSS